MAIGVHDQPAIIAKDQIRVHAEASNPGQARMLEELVALRHQIQHKTGLTFPETVLPIDIYLFDDEASFRSFTSASNAVFADRRAFFIGSKDALNVYGFWGMQVAEDLRHEVTHGYLHSIRPDIPLWIDEGLAEYFEVGANLDGYNLPHVQRLAQLYQAGGWQPDLEVLESISDPRRFTQTDYAEAWLWTHWMLYHEQGQQILKTRLRSSTAIPALSWSEEVGQQIGDSTQLVQHLLRLAAEHPISPINR